MTRSEPSAAKARAIASPMPRVAPVISAVRPRSRAECEERGMIGVLTVAEQRMATKARMTDCPHDLDGISGHLFDDVSADCREVEGGLLATTTVLSRPS